VEFLTRQLAMKEDQIQRIESQYAGMDSIAKNEIDKQRNRFEEINSLYTSLKTQVSQFSDALSQKESELEQRRRETASLREEINGLKSRSASLESELTDARERQKKTLDDLISAVKLNTILQERAMGIAPSGSASSRPSAQQQKADELKRKIEVILEPEK
jgi:chromosome segregation ATPase